MKSDIESGPIVVTIAYPLEDIDLNVPNATSEPSAEETPDNIPLTDEARIQAEVQRRLTIALYAAGSLSWWTGFILLSPLLGRAMFTKAGLDESSRVDDVKAAALGGSLVSVTSAVFTLALYYLLKQNNVARPMFKEGTLFAIGYQALMATGTVALGAAILNEKVDGITTTTAMGGLVLASSSAAAYRLLSMFHCCHADSETPDYRTHRIDFA